MLKGVAFQRKLGTSNLVNESPKKIAIALETRSPLPAAVIPLGFVDSFVRKRAKDRA